MVSIFMEGRRAFIVDKLKIKLLKGKSLEQIADDLDEDIEEIQAIALEHMLI